MKNFKIYNILVLLLVVCFNTFSVTARNSSHFSRNLDPRNFDLSQKDINTKGLFFEEVSINPAPQIDSEDYFNAPGILFYGSYHPPLSSTFSCPAVSWNFVQDKREDLASQIFPFHFFW